MGGSSRFDPRLREPTGPCGVRFSLAVPRGGESQTRLRPWRAGLVRSWPVGGRISVLGGLKRPERPRGLALGWAWPWTCLLAGSSTVEHVAVPCSWELTTKLVSISAFRVGIAGMKLSKYSLNSQSEGWRWFSDRTLVSCSGPYFRSPAHLPNLPPPHTQKKLNLQSG